MAVVLPGSFIYLATIHTASTTTANALKQIEGAFAAYDKRHGIGHLANLEQVRKVCGDRLTGTETVFTTVRNPYDLLVTWFESNRSHFQMRRLEDIQGGKEGTFLQFLELWLAIDQPPYMLDKRIFYQAEDARFVLRFEELQANLDALMRKLPKTPPHLPINLGGTSPVQAHWSTYYTDDIYTLVNDSFKHDFVKHGYPFVWSAAQLA